MLKHDCYFANNFLVERLETDLGHQLVKVGDAGDHRRLDLNTRIG